MTKIALLAGANSFTMLKPRKEKGERVSPMFRIPLRVEGVDLQDPAIFERIDEHLSDIAWSQVSGRVLVSVFTESSNPVGAAVDVAHHIENVLSGAAVKEVDQDLVNISDIAHRAGVSRETVRLWSEGRRGNGDFPSAAGSPGGSKVWRWSPVSTWLADNYSLSDPSEYAELSDQEIAELNAALHRVPSHADTEWKHAQSFSTAASIIHGAVQPSALSVVSWLPDAVFAVRIALAAEFREDVEMWQAPASIGGRND